MYEILEKIVNNEFDNGDYDVDYKKKLGNNNYQNYLNDDEQLSFFNFKKFLIDHYSSICKEINSIKLNYLYDSVTHGVNHNIRVLIFAYYISYEFNLNFVDFRIIMDACKYHDIGRVNDLYDEKHGLRSSKMIDKVVDDEIYSDVENLNMLKAIIEYHSIPDSRFNKVFRSYKLSDESRFKMLSSILKDADGLDRVRLSINNRIFSDLNPRYLRLEESKRMVKISHILNYMFVSNNDKLIKKIG